MGKLHALKITGFKMRWYQLHMLLNRDFFATRSVIKGGGGGGGE